MVQEAGTGGEVSRCVVGENFERGFEIGFVLLSLGFKVGGYLHALREHCSSRSRTPDQLLHHGRGPLEGRDLLQKDTPPFIRP